MLNCRFTADAIHTRQGAAVAHADSIDALTLLFKSDTNVYALLRY